jgi:hypothetical protein
LRQSQPSAELSASLNQHVMLRHRWQNFDPPNRIFFSAFHPCLHHDYNLLE